MESQYILLEHFILNLIAIMVDVFFVFLQCVVPFNLTLCWCMCVCVCVCVKSTIEHGHHKVWCPSTVLSV